MSFVQSVRSVYSRYAKFDGRATRPEYWWFQLFFATVLVGGVFLTALVYDAFSRALSPAAALIALALGVFVVVTFIPQLAVSVRRLHDSNHSGWWLLINLVPYIGGLIALVFMALPSTQGYNRYGPAHGQTAGQQRRVRYFAWNRAEALRQFAEDAQGAAAAGYQPVWQEWTQQGGGELLEVVYELQQLPPWPTPPPPRG